MHLFTNSVEILLSNCNFHSQKMKFIKDEKKCPEYKKEDRKNNAVSMVRRSGKHGAEFLLVAC